MRLEMTGSFDADGSAASSNDLLFLGFHGYSNDESGMVRIINAICATGSPDNTHHANANGNGNVNSNTNRNPAADPPIKPNYISFRGAYTRPYIGSHYWYPDGCSVSERQHECSQVGAEVVCMLQSPVFQRFRKVLIGFSQGGYLSYRMTTEYPDVFDMAVLLSPSFKGKQRTRSLPAAHDSRFATAVMTVRFQSPTSSVPMSNLARPVVARISNIPAWCTTYVIRKLPTCAPGWDCEPWRVLTYHA